MTEEYLRHRSGVAELVQHMIRFKNPNMEEDELLTWFLAGFFHDVGKEVISKRYPALLTKTTKLTDYEWNIIRTHTEIGHEVIRESNIKGMSNVVFAALEHHERWNGSGYMGKKGSGISLPGRILAVADVFDALCHNRPYRKAWGKAAALDYMRQNRRILFDPEWADVLISIEQKAGGDGC